MENKERIPATDQLVAEGLVSIHQDASILPVVREIVNVEGQTVQLVDTGASLCLKSTWDLLEANRDKIDASNFRRVDLAELRSRL